MTKPPYLMGWRELWRTLLKLEDRNIQWRPLDYRDEWVRRRVGLRDWLLIGAAILAAVAAMVTAWAQWQGLSVPPK